MKNNLKEWIHNRGMTYREFASRLYVSHAIIYKYIDGSRTPSLPIALNMARILDCRVEDLFTVD